jgi:ubiquinone/menaquinone biosynthesis C-methylase UbiE
MKKNYSIINKFFYFILYYARSNIYKTFIENIKFNKKTKVLDVGTTPLAHKHENFFIHEYPYKQMITCLSNQKLDSLKKILPKIKFLRGDARKIKIKNSKFDLVYSNATIEHVGKFKNQIKFIEEALRVSKKFVFISTPNKYFPIELHTFLPLIHFLPQKYYRFILRKLGLNFFAEEKNLNLLSTNNIKNICKILRIRKYKIIKMKFLLFTSNLILIIKK